MFKIKEVFNDLLKIDSRTYSKGEVDIAKYLYNRFLELDYIKENPDSLRLISTDEDEFLRFNQVAIIKKGEKKEAVVLINTIDEPALSQTTFKSDIENIKASLANSLIITENIIDKLKDGMFIVYNICDRYGTDKGILKVIKHMETLKSEGINIKCAITTHDYLTKNDRYIYFGSQALFRPAIFVAGRPVTSLAFNKGLDPSYLLSSIVRNLTLSSPLMESFEGEVSEPIYVNKLIVPGGAEFSTAPWGYASFITSSLNYPAVTYMQKLKDTVKKVYENSIEELNSKYATYCLKRNIKFNEIDNKKKVYTWEEYMNELVTVHGNSIISNVRNKKEEYLNRNPEISNQELRLALVQYVYDNFKLADEPIVILYYEEFPYARVDINATTDDQRNVMTAFTSAINKISPDVKRRFFYPEFSYHSYMAKTDDIRELKDSLKLIPEPEEELLERIRLSNELSIPTVNVGGATIYTDDMYKFDEDYALNIIPKIIENAVLKLLGD